MTVDAVGFLYTLGLWIMNQKLLEFSAMTSFGVLLAFSLKDWIKVKKAIKDDARLKDK